MKNRCFASRIIFLVAAVTLATIGAKADELYCRIRGSINDPSGRALPGVHVSARTTQLVLRDSSFQARMDLTS